MEEERKFSSNNLLLAIGGLLLVVALVAVAGFFLLTPPDDFVMGQAEATQVRISSKVPGRVAAYYHAEGDRVRKGDSLVRLNIPDIQAKLLQAEALRRAAEAQDAKALAGARRQEITGAYELWQKAKAGLDIAAKSYHRAQNLFAKGVVPAQKRDEAEANYKAMQATEKAAHSQYDLAVAGARREDKEAAAALVSQASGAVAEAESYVNESLLRSPIDGEVSERYPQPGELVGSGAPIMDITDLNDQWVSFSLREDLLQHIHIGTELRAFIPALGKKEVRLKVYYMKDMGSYAVWRATKTTGGFDAKTFELRARPETKIDGLRPGMSVVIPKKGNKIL
ncbi:MAG: efflux RND transporter periplasmic adaptor subunit [Tannerella sp.]|jgi:HlyD family secretion protein|nr:efflux RND transporter periplasmic adaptor subunit [Tannerella sp.]